MGGKKVPAEGSKKAAGQARKADAAASKAAAEDAKKAATEDKEWQKGAKNSSKKEAEAEKKAEQARKKAEREALLADDERNTPGRAVPKKKKTAVPKSTTRGLDLSQLSLDDNKEASLAASGMKDVYDLMEAIDDKDTSSKLVNHAEKKVGPAWYAFHERRDQELKKEKTGLNFSQRREQIREEFKTSPENPKNQDTIAYNATKEEKQAALQAQKAKREAIFAQS